MKIVLTFIIILTYFFPCESQGVQHDPLPADSTIHWHHPYHQTLVMKMFLSKPDGRGGSKIYIGLEQAMKLIREVDNLTLGVPKIIYLVGWQYNGHDDKYPAFFEVNPALKRVQDTNSRESLRWLMKEAKKYHTTISLHINMTDAYEDSPLWNEYVANDLVSKNADGSLMVIGNYNNRKSFQVNYRNEWEKGFAQKRIDSLLHLLPELKEAGTIHIDAWIARESKGHNEPVETERDYQKKICRYWLQKGVDPTSEWIMDYMTGLVPYYWHFNGQTQAGFLKYPASVLTGSHMNPDLTQTDFGLELLFGTSMYGENRFPNADRGITDDGWDTNFTGDFYLNFLQYYFLNRLNRQKVDGIGNNRIAYFSGNVTVSLADSTVYQNDRLLRKGSALCFPALWRNDNSWVAYSQSNSEWLFKLPTGWKGTKTVETFLITRSGLVNAGKIHFSENQTMIKLTGGKPLLILPVKR